MNKHLRQLKAAFETNVNIPAEEWDAFVRIVGSKRILAGGAFIALGANADLIGFVGSGLFKVMYVNASGQKFIRNFCAEGEFVSCYTEAINGELARAEIQAIEDSEVLFFSYSQFSQFYRAHHSWSELGRKYAEKYFSFREQREHQLLSQPAVDRYRNFLIEFKSIVHRLRQADVAAYIGVTPESLSRLLKNRGGEN